MQRFCFAALWACLMLLIACQQNPGTNATAPANTPATDTLSRRTPDLPNPWKEATCDLLTDTEFYTLFGVEEKRDVANRRSLTNFCLRSWKKTDWREREAIELRDPRMSTKPENMLAIKVLDFGSLAMAQEEFDMYKRDRIHGLSEAISDLGEAALWSDAETMLFVKKGSLCLQIQLDMTENAHDNLPKAREVALTALKKM